MSSEDVAIAASFVEGAPPGELGSVIADIQALTTAKLQAGDALAPAFAKYNEDQFVTVPLPGGGAPVLVSADNRLETLGGGGSGRYYDTAAARSFVVEHRSHKVSDVQPHAVEGALAAAALKALAAYVKDHYEHAALGVYPLDDGARLAVLIVSNKYSPQNYWNGRWRSRYVFDPASGALEGAIRVDVHYYEDGNVRLLTDKPQAAAVKTAGAAASATATGAALAHEIAALEKAYQEELNRKFLALSESTFKGLRRQLPVTRQKIEWDKVASYRLGQDIGGGGARR